METCSHIDYEYLREIIFSRSQNVLEPSCDYLFETRLHRLLQRSGMTRLEELVRLSEAAQRPNP